MKIDEIKKYADHPTEYNYRVLYNNSILIGYFEATETADKDKNKWNFVPLHQKDNKTDKITLDGNLIQSITRI
jgi:hypothetical protein